MNKIVKLGSIFFTLVLLVLSGFKYSSGNIKVAVYYLIAAAGFFLIFLSYRNKENSSK